MSYHVKVSGIPAHVKLPSLKPLLSDILSMDSSDFYLRALSSKGPYNEILLGLATYVEAQSVQKKLDNFVYKNNNVSFKFTAKICSYIQDSKKSKSKSNKQNKNIKRSYGHKQSYQMEQGYNRNQSRSPHNSSASSHLDMQLEILRKQRMIVEEERKLFEEQKKLKELMMKSLNNATPPLAKEVYEDIKMPGPSANPRRKKSQAKQLNFYQASTVVLRNMYKFIQKYSTLEDHKALLKRLRAIIKDRMAIAVSAAGEGIYHTPIVIRLYRSQYPQSDDKKLVKETMKDIKRLSAKGLSVDNTEVVQTAAKGANAKNKPDGVKSSAGNHQLEDETATAKDTNRSGDSNVCVLDIDTKTSTKPNQNNTNKKNTEKRLFFHNASGVLMHKMRVHINKYVPKKKRKLFEEYLRSTLKQRLSAVVAGQPIYQTHVIINMYRELYPQTEDEELIKRLLNDIEKGDMPNDINDKLKNVETGSVPDEKTVVIDNETPVGETIIGEDATDATGQSDKEGTDDSGNIVDKVNVDTKFESTVESLDKQNTEKDNTDDNPGIDPNVKNAENPNNIDNDPKMDLVICNTQNDPAKCNIDNNCTSNNNTKTDTAIEDKVMETIEKPDIEEDNINENTGISNEKENSSKSSMINCNLKNDAVKFNIADECNSNNDSNTDVAPDVVQICTDNTETSVKDNHGVKRKNDEHDDNSNKVPKTSDDVISLV